MAAYATPDQVRHTLARDLTRTTGSAASLGDDELSAHIDTAQAEVDAALAGGGYTLPLASVPALVGDVTAAIAAWHADLSYRQGKGYDTELNPVLQRYRWAKALLDGWATGRRAIPGLDDTGERNGDVTMGDPVNPYDGNLFGPADAFPPSPGWAAQEPLYDPDAYRWGLERGWF